jgi:hypothetical protein
MGRTEPDASPRLHGHAPMARAGVSQSFGDLTGLNWPRRRGRNPINRRHSSGDFEGCRLLSHGGPPLHSVERAGALAAIDWRVRGTSGHKESPASVKDGAEVHTQRNRTLSAGALTGKNRLKWLRVVVSCLPALLRRVQQVIPQEV